MKLFRGFALAAATMAFALVVLGSWVRINGAGMTCPDWPLCHGALVPSLQGGVALEWSHRLVAFLEGFVILGLIVTGFTQRRRIAGVTPALVALAIVFAAQVLLGGLTIFLANNPVSVTLHWGMAMALLATLTVLAVLASLAPERVVPGSRRVFGGTAAPALALAAGFAFVTMCAGAYVSSSFVGLACSSVPLCNGNPFGSNPAQFAQMFHRSAAYTFALVAVGALYAARGASRRVVASATAGVALICLQIGLGFANVVWHLPLALREAHAANAGATFVTFVVATILASLDPSPAAAPDPERARTPQIANA